jgi:uncharacterized protein YdeI (BOF family)
VRIESDSYVIRELSGRETRVFYDRNTRLDNVAVGDNVAVQFNGTPPNTYATSITRRTASAVPPVATLPPAVVVPPVVDPLPHPRTIEGTVHHQWGNEYEIRDINGREWNLIVDSRTTRDSNITAGDRVMAITSDMPAGYYVYRYGNPNLIQGDVVRIDDERYIIRDATGREIRVRVDDLNRRHSLIRVGDRVILIPRGDRYGPPYEVYRVGDPGFLQGDIVRLESNCYIVRDLSGRETCLYQNSPTVWYDPVVVGDRVIAYNSYSNRLHADFIAKR